MTKLESRFKIEKDRNPNYSDTITLLHAVEYQMYSEQEIIEAVIQLVDKEDFDERDFGLVVDHLFSKSHSRRP